jgi:hypothetical protein
LEQAILDNPIPTHPIVSFEERMRFSSADSKTKPRNMPPPGRGLPKLRQFPPAEGEEKKEESLEAG